MYIRPISDDLLHDEVVPHLWHKGCLTGQTVDEGEHLVWFLVDVCTVLYTWMYLLISAVGLLYYGQDMLLYYPCQPPNSRLYVDLPSIVQLPYENHFIRTRDGVFINVVLIKQKSPDCRSCPTLIYFHGNAGNIGHRLLYVYIYCVSYMHRKLIWSLTLQFIKGCNNF